MRRRGLMTFSPSLEGKGCLGWPIHLIGSIWSIFTLVLGTHHPVLSLRYPHSIIPATRDGLRCPLFTTFLRSRRHPFVVCRPIHHQYLSKKPRPAFPIAHLGGADPLKHEKTYSLATPTSLLSLVLFRLSLHFIVSLLSLILESSKQGNPVAD